MNRAGKFPTSLSSGDDIMGRITEIRSTIKFQLKKVLCMGCCVGHVEMSAEDLKYVKQVSFFFFIFSFFSRLNITLAINFLVSLLKKNWQNLKSVHIKSTMGKPQRVF